MERYQQILQRLAKQSYNQDQNMPLFLALCEQKDPAILPKISYGSWCPYSSDLTAALPVLDQWKDDEYLLYAALLNAGGGDLWRLREAIDGITGDKPSAEIIAAWRQRLLDLGQNEEELDYLIAEAWPVDDHEQLNAIGAYMLNWPDERLLQLLGEELQVPGRYANSWRSGSDPVSLRHPLALLKHIGASDSSRLDRLASGFLSTAYGDEWIPSETASGMLVALGGAACRAQVEQVARSAPDLQLRLQACIALVDSGDAGLQPSLIELTPRMLGECQQYTSSFSALVVTVLVYCGEDALPMLTDIFAGTDPLCPALPQGGIDAELPDFAFLPLMAAGTRQKDPQTALFALKQLDQDERPEARQAWREGMGVALVSFKDPPNSWQYEGTNMASYYNQLLGMIQATEADRFGDELTELLGHKRSSTAKVAIRHLVRLKGAAMTSVGSELLAGRNKQLRLNGALLLIAIGSEEALSLIEGHVASEKDDATRDLIMATLIPRWQESGSELGLDRLEEFKGQMAKKLAKPIAKWLDTSSLAPLCLSDGTELATDWLSWLLYRQSRASGMDLDPEAALLIALLNRDALDGTLLSLWQAFSGTKMDAKDRWVLGLCRCLRSDSLLTAWHQQAITWAEKGRGKMSEYLVQIMAAQGSDQALMLVDDLAARYASKQRNVGAAANEALSAAAAERGISIDELGDLVVPWLGFEGGAERVLEAADKRIQLSVGLDGKLRYRDLVKNKLVKSLPTAFGKEGKADMKTLAASLRSAMKTQRLRHERMLIGQRRWPAADWAALYLQHPVLLPFAVTLVWGLYDEAGELQRCFRMLEDRSLSDAEDDEVEAPAQGFIGLVHPLELDDSQRSSWTEHLDDHEITPPFPQLGRAVHSVAASEQEKRHLTTVEGISISAGTFRSRAERRGWRRGSVIDAGGVSSYVRAYPQAKVEVFLMLDEFYIGIDPMESISLGQVFFVTAESVETGSYVYDEPADETDPRCLALGDIPAIVASETLADLALFKAGQENDDED